MQTFVFIGNSLEDILAGVKKNRTFAIEVSDEFNERGLMTGKVVATNSKPSWQVGHESSGWAKECFKKVDRRIIPHFFSKISPDFVP